MQKPEAAAEIEPITAEMPTKAWYKPVATFLPASSAENGPGAAVDSGLDLS